MTYRYPLATSSWDDAETAAMQRVIASGQFTMGENVAEFERRFADYVGSKHCVMVNSGSSANLLMVAALFYVSDERSRLKAGDEVLVPAVSWSTTYFPLHQYGLKLRFVDIDLQTLNYDVTKLADAVTPETRAIMLVNLLGNPNEFTAIRQIADKYDLVLIEDNCESMGATYECQQAGTFGLMGTFSAFFSHHISTMEGGMIVTDNREIAEILICLRAHGWTRHLPKNNLVCGEKSDDPFEESFRFVLPGYNLRPLELSGAIGIEQVKRLPDLISARRENGRRFQEVMGNHPDLMIQQEIGQSSWFGFSLVIRPGSRLDRKNLRHRLQAKGFECRPIVAGNFPKNEAVRFFNYTIHSELSAAEHVDSNGLFIGNHHYDINNAIEDLINI